MTEQPTVPYRKGTVLIDSGSNNHLYIICCDPVFYPPKDENCVLMVNVSTARPPAYIDWACILERGDHDFIHTTSYVYYRKAVIESAAALRDAIIDYRIPTHQDMDNEPFQKVLSGFEASEDVTAGIMKFYRTFCK